MEANQETLNTGAAMSRNRMPPALKSIIQKPWTAVLILRVFWIIPSLSSWV